MRRPDYPETPNHHGRSFYVNSLTADNPERNGTDTKAQRATRRYRGVSYTRPIDAAKEAVPVIDLADRLCGPGGLRRVGKEWVGRCVLTGHEPDQSLVPNPTPHDKE
jgi:hypothetical protein